MLPKLHPIALALSLYLPYGGYRKGSLSLSGGKLSLNTTISGQCLPIYYVPLDSDRGFSGWVRAERNGERPLCTESLSSDSYLSLANDIQVRVTCPQDEHPLSGSIGGSLYHWLGRYCENYQEKATVVLVRERAPSAASTSELLSHRLGSITIR